MIEVCKSIDFENGGIPTTFFRVDRCNLHCKGCDQKELLDESKKVDIFDKDFKRPEGHVTLTGGEPLLFYHVIEKLNPDTIYTSGFTSEADYSLLTSLRWDFVHMQIILSDHGLFSDGQLIRLNNDMRIHLRLTPERALSIYDKIHLNSCKIMVWETEKGIFDIEKAKEASFKTGIPICCQGHKLYDIY